MSIYYRGFLTDKKMTLNKINIDRARLGLNYLYLFYRYARKFYTQDPKTALTKYDYLYVAEYQGKTQIKFARPVS
jgi:hypothetical protein